MFPNKFVYRCNESPTSRKHVINASRKPLTVITINIILDVSHGLTGWRKFTWRFDRIQCRALRGRFMQARSWDKAWPPPRTTIRVHQSVTPRKLAIWQSGKKAENSPMPRI